ncbi:hypothetical protein DV096_03085 [Bradymonadaceae bacterium TMQ3]|nr:hypothetical protein DV096_03085 [Bradymonadaceae bacterium TMQ3]
MVRGEGDARRGKSDASSKAGTKRGRFNPPTNVVGWARIPGEGRNVMGGRVARDRLGLLFCRRHEIMPNFNDARRATLCVAGVL